MAKNKVINTVLRLKDEMSGGMVKAAKKTQGVSKEMQAATRQVVAFKNKAVSSISSAVQTFGKLTAAAGAATAALAFKTGFSEALDLEGYRLQLETATKDTQKASDIMRYAIELANKTPFEGGQMVEGAAKFEAMGMAATTWLTRAGDMAAATNKDFDQAVEALIDAQTGELERLKEFGITKAMILQRGEEMFSGVQIANNKGQIVNQEKFNEAMIALMEDKFSGGMAKQATTMKGLWSTVTGITKSALANMVGITSDGSIRTGSALDLLKGKVEVLATKLVEWQQDGTIDRLATQLTNGLGMALDTAGRAFSWLQDRGGQLIGWVRDNQDTIVRVLKTIGAAWGISKVLQFAGAIMAAKTALGLFLHGAFAILAANPVTLFIYSIVAAGALLIANWDKVKAYAGAVYSSVKECFGGVGAAISGAFQWAKDSVTGFFDWIGEKLSWLGGKIQSIPVLGSLISGAKTIGSGILDAVGNAGQSLSSALGNALSASTVGVVGHNAVGTNYWRGGLTRVHERGGEILNLPGGTQIIPHDISQRMAGGRTVNVYVTIQGNVVGNRQFAREVGEEVAGQILEQLDNIA